MPSKLKLVLGGSCLLVLAFFIVVKPQLIETVVTSTELQELDPAEKVQGTTYLEDVLIEYESPGVVKLTWSNKGVVENFIADFPKMNMNDLNSYRADKVTIESSTATARWVITRVQGASNTEECTPTSSNVIRSGDAMFMEGITASGSACEVRIN